jgi:diguanylate cyclase
LQNQSLNNSKGKDMEYSDSLEASSGYLRLALKYMGQYRILLDPVNYTVWYEYVSGKNQRLKTAIESYISVSGSFSADVSLDLYKRYIEDEKVAIIETIRTEVRKALDETLKHVIETGSNISSYEKVLETYSGLIVKGIDVEELNKIVSDIINETKNMEESSGLLQSRLRKTIVEVEVFRNDLLRLREEAVRDILTGLLNRRAFEEIIIREINSADEKGRNLCMIIADMDYFKRINDTFGHLVGDHVLRKAAEIIKTFIKGRDIAARYGGEEFVILLPDTPKQGAITVAEKIRILFETTQWEKKGTGDRIGAVTLSLGVAWYARGESAESFIERADKCLYEAKKGGRNRVSF